MSDTSSPQSSRRAYRSRQRRTALVVVLSLILGLVGATGIVPTQPAAAAVSVAQVSNWKFDAGTGTTAADSVGTKTATLGTGATWTPGIRGASSLALNGTSTSTATTSGPVLTTSSSFSVTAYVKLNSLTSYQTFVSQDGTSVSGFYLSFRGDTGKFGFARESVDGAGSTTSLAGAAAAPVVGQWYHLTGVYNSTAGTLALYVNGRLQATTSTTGNFNTTGNFVMGRGKYGGAPVDFVNGTIDDVRAYSGALTAADVEQIADSAYYKLDEGTGTTAADAGLNANNATMVNSPTWTPGVIGPAAVAFDGTNESVDAGNSVLDTSKSFTVTAWARAGSVTQTSVVASVQGASVSAFKLQMQSNGTWAFARPATDSTSATIVGRSSTAAATVDTWYHLAGVYDSVAGTISLYVNGVKQSTSVSYTTGWKGTGLFALGRGSVGSTMGYFAGAVDDVHAYPFVLEDAMITALAAPPPPPAPATPTATVSGNSVTLTWDAPAPIAGSPTTGYVVTPYVNGTALPPQTFNTTATTQTFTGLNYGSSYRYTVAAINANGTSAPSPQSTAVVPAAVPSAPAAPTATAGSLSANVSWTAPANNGSAITGYVVTPYVGTTAGTAQTFTSTATTQTVTGLTAGTAYTFTVAAVNAVGTGAQSTASNTVTPNANPTIAVVSPPSGQVGVAYSFTFTRSGGTSPFTWSVSAGTLPGGLTLGASTGVLSGTPTTAGSYPFTVKVTDASGATDTEPVTVVVNGVPAKPNTPSATAGVTSASVSWTAPASNGSAITGYVITPYIGGTAQPAQTYNSTATTQTLTGLTAGTAYTFTVAAVNALGTGPASNQSTAVTPYNVPSAPAAPTATAGAQSATVTWAAPSTNGSAITGYRVTPTSAPPRKLPWPSPAPPPPRPSPG